MGVGGLGGGVDNLWVKLQAHIHKSPNTLHPATAITGNAIGLGKLSAD